MKRIIASVLIIISILSVFCACSKKEKSVPEKLDNITSGYTGDIKIGQVVKVKKLNIVLGKYIFTINDIRFRYKDFENSPKRTMKFEDKVSLDMYVVDASLKKCILREGDEYGTTVLKAVFNPDGNATDYYKYEYDDFSNIICRMHYDKDGKLESFFTAEYNEETQNQTAKYIYSGNYVLKQVIKYNYDENGKLVSTAYYDNKGQLVKIV